ncbi:MAG: hypothetical protein IJB32_02190, partial [Clostridia bacterium]|nr:hypothetical protein [Clostridia bacterium]
MNGLGRKNENKEKNQSIFTKETFGVVMILFATLCLVCLITGDSLFSTPGALVSSFLFGCFGFFAYAVVIWAISFGVLLVADKKLNVTRKRKALITLAFVLIALLSHVISMASESLDYSNYLSASYSKGAGGVATTSGGGVFTGLVAYAFSALLTNVGSYVVLSIAIVVTAYFLILDFIKAKSNSKTDTKAKFKSSYVENENPIIDSNIKIEGVMDYPVNDVAFNSKPAQKLFVNNPDDFSLKTKREKAKEDKGAIKLDLSNNGIAMVNYSDSYTKAYGDEIKKKIDYIKTPATIDVEKTVNNTYYKSHTGTTVSDYVAERVENKEEQPISEIPFFEHEGDSVQNDDSAKSNAERFMSDYLEISEVEEVVSNIEPAETFRPITEESKPTENDSDFLNASSRPSREDIFRPFATPKQEENLKAETENFDVFENTETFEQAVEEKEEEKKDEQPPVSSIIRDRRTLFGENISDKEETVDKPSDFTEKVVEENGLGGRRSRMFDMQIEPEIETEPKEEIEKPKKPAPPINRVYNRPPFDLLETHTAPINAGKENHEERMEIIQRTLEEFHINAVPQSYIQGPSITRYEIMMPAGVSVKKVLNYDDDLKMRLSAKEGVRIEAPIPGKNLVGVEVANTVKTMVGFREVMEGLAEKQQKKGALWFAIGKDIVGNSISYDLSKGPHYLIAGATGSGKSVCLHVMLVSLLMRYSPEELKLVLVDPKSVEFRKYEHIPHLLVDEIITEPKRVLTLLQWAYDETNRRNDMFTACGGEVSNIDDYNNLIASDTVPKLPRIVFFIDELADLMENCKKD